MWFHLVRLRNTESILPPRIADLPQCDPLCPDVTVLGEGRGQCRICGTVLKTLVAARSHVRKIHLSGGCIECALCGGQAKNRQAFAMHLLRRHQLRGEKQALESYGRAAAPSPGVAAAAAVAPPLDGSMDLVEPKIELILDGSPSTSAPPAQESGGFLP